MWVSAVCFTLGCAAAAGLYAGDGASGIRYSNFSTSFAHYDKKVPKCSTFKLRVWGLSSLQSRFWATAVRKFLGNVIKGAV